MRPLPLALSRPRRSRVVDIQVSPSERATLRALERQGVPVDLIDRIVRALARADHLTRRTP